MLQKDAYHDFNPNKLARVFSHAHTYQGHPVGCAAALEVQRIIREENLVENVRANGEYLGQLLHKHLDSHPHVGDIRGRGFFWSVSSLKAPDIISTLGDFEANSSEAGIRCR